MKKIVMVLLIFAVAGGAAFAFDIESFADPIEPGNILISPAFNFGFAYFSGIALSVTVAGDYALPIPVMVGLEAGFGTIVGGYSDYMPSVIPILARVSWHPNFEVDGLDVYARLKLGYGVGFGRSDNDGRWSGGFSYGAGSGVRYFFTDTIGVFGELGYDRYGLSYRWDGYSGYLGSGRIYAYYYTWFHAGVTFKVGG